MGTLVWFKDSRADSFKHPESLGRVPSWDNLVAKSHKTAVYQGETVAHLEVGGPYQATGGMGDTLAGMITGFSGPIRFN